MGFKDELDRARADRMTTRDLTQQQDQKLLSELDRLKEDAHDRLREAADVLAAAGIPTLEARLAHKERPNWRWPTGSGRVTGWVFNCGDQPVMLRPDGWLAPVHTCSDSKRTLCACGFTRTTEPVPGQSLTIADEPGPEESTEAETPQSLLIRTMVNGELADLEFNTWLINEVADLLDGGPSDR